MIGDAADRQRGHLIFPGDPAEVWPKAFPDFRGQHRFAALRAEDTMHKTIDEGILGSFVPAGLYRCDTRLPSAKALGYCQKPTAERRADREDPKAGANLHRVITTAIAPRRTALMNFVTTNFRRLTPAMRDGDEQAT